MRTKRIKTYIIDFLILTLILFIINSVIPQTDRIKNLKNSQNEIAEIYYKGDISYSTYINTYSKVTYQLDKELVLNNLIYLSMMIIYFVVVPIIFHGKTLGSYLEHIQIESFNSKKLSYHQIIIRALTITGFGYVLIKNILIFILNENTYFIGLSFAALIQVIFLGTCIYTMIRKKDRRGLHEILSNTEMVKINVIPVKK